ncbi:MAG: hypothetical protein HYW71_02895 [Candidatus Niyogibacteria bacterium]|nr:hypothetical protein [Candidatus Niyogibacteria bacterium]
MADKKSKKIRDDIRNDLIEIPALFFINYILLPGSEYEITLNKLPQISEKNYLKLKIILNERYQKQMEIAIVCFERTDSTVCLREWGVIARITGLFPFRIDASPLDLRVRVMGRCRVFSFSQNEEQDNCFFAAIKIAPVLAISEEEWQSNEIQKLKNGIIEDFFEFAGICAEIAAIFSENNHKDKEEKFLFLFLFSQKTAISMELCLNFKEFIKIINEWLDCVCLEKEAVFSYKFRFLSLDGERQQMRMIKNTINNLIGMAENTLLKGDSPSFKEDLWSGKRNFSAENRQSSEKYERDFSAAQKELSERLEEVLKKLNLLKNVLTGGEEK